MCCGADLRSPQFPREVEELVGVHTLQDFPLEPEGVNEPASVGKWEVGGLVVAVFWACGFVAFWAQSAFLPVSAEFQIHPQGCSVASTGKGGLFRQEVVLGPNALPGLLGANRG